MRRRLLWLACPWIMVIGACSPGIDEATPETTMEPSEESAAAAANDAVPPGVDLEFEVFGANLDEKGGDNPASIVAPVDWRQDASTFGFTFEPPADSDLGPDSTYAVENNCDGLCGPTDWEERLTGPDGYLTRQADDGVNVVERRETTGSAGAVLITEESDTTVVRVLRWDDSAPEFFTCEATIEAGAEDLVPAFEAACLASRPEWFPVD